MLSSSYQALSFNYDAFSWSLMKRKKTNVVPSRPIIIKALMIMDSNVLMVPFISLARMMPSKSDQRHRSLIPFLPRVVGIIKYVPNPFAWVPRPRFLGGGRRRAPNVIVTAASNMAASSSSSTHSTSGTASTVSKVPLKPASDIFAGALARAASQSTIHPLDTLKVRLQTRHGTAQSLQGLSKIGQLVPPPSGTASAAMLQMDFRALGANVSSLYRGVFGAASGAGIAIGAYFAFYGVACNTISTRMPDLSSGRVAFAAGGVAALGSRCAP